MYLKKRKKVFGIVVILVLAGIFTLQRLWLGKTSDHKKSLLSNVENNEVKDSTNVPSSQESYGRPEGSVGKELVHTTFTQSVNHKGSLLPGRENDKWELPDPFEKGDIEVAIAKLDIYQIWKMQDNVMDKWPDYSDIQEQLQKELFAEIKPNTLSDDEIVQIASELREKFWHAGGGLAQTSYVNAYKARVLLEWAHDQTPQNMLITDALVESIQTAHLISKFNFKANRFLKNDNVVKALLDLRAQQYEQLRDEIVQGRKPTIADFLRSVDLAFLYQGIPEHRSSSKKIVQWLRSNANLGGWAEHNKDLSGWEEALGLGYKYGFNIYIPTKHKNPEDEIRYGRRLPSFFGPEKRGAFLRIDGPPGFQFHKEIVIDHVNN